jgi:hypothetical protein
MLYSVKETENFGVEVVCDNPEALKRKIQYTGAGFYSLANDGVYYAGIKATFSRIELIGLED